MSTPKKGRGIKNEEDPPTLVQRGPGHTQQSLPRHSHAASGEGAGQFQRRARRQGKLARHDVHLWAAMAGSACPGDACKREGLPDYLGLGLRAGGTHGRRGRLIGTIKKHEEGKRFMPIIRDTI